MYIEPGGYIVRDSGLMVLQVNMVERKKDVDFIGVDGGMNLDMEPVFYNLTRFPVPCRLTGTDSSASSGASGKKRCFTIAGNINEAIDIWAENFQLPDDIREGDYLAFLNAGGYGVASSSNHCMRGSLSEFLLL